LKGLECYNGNQMKACDITCNLISSCLWNDVHASCLQTSCLPNSPQLTFVAIYSTLT